ncbi:DUF4857 domain-containing protein [Halarcobacter mediterraneus]|uniref:DUF4857 domain-containing protein n=1 Tax=Halarcobacter mediterraneus TaxID=2023153 RepID=A0A4Q1B1N4_9BACT|nr:DUF4857 domain-containing protein [Halarcobacter mediterraneus]RXK11697.1 DUF4857 domain-containing protein [Halarcobacter mediterraneus]
MINSIIKKEWLKIKPIFFILNGIAFTLLGNFWYNLNFSFKTVEPESMMWYRFTSLEQKPYEYLFYLYLLIGLSISVFQFVPEKIRNRIKIMSHLPISMSKSLFLHLFIGIFYIFILSIGFSLALIFIISQYYPNEILLVSIKDISFYFLGSIIIYLTISSSIIEKNLLISSLKLFIGILFIFIFQKSIFTSIDLIWIPIAILMFFITLDSFYSIKEQRLTNTLFRLLSFLSIVIVIYLSFDMYKSKYKHDFNKYYIFYSPIVKDFVYQKNFGDHQFEYGIKNQETFDRTKYESYLPFVYWRNLDIQGKLPIKIDNEIYDKKTIKESRLSFSYNPTLLKRQEVQMYPLLNPHSKIGMIKFPEEMIALRKNDIKIYNFDERLDKKLTTQLNKLLKTNNVSFPIKDIWGKSTNMKPFDLGYFFLDSKNKLFKLNRYDNKIHLQEVNYPNNIQISFMKISENKKRELAGFAIDSKNDFYIIDYQTLKFRKIELKNFNYKKMKLLFISNPKYYLVRYTDNKNYYAVVFDKNFKKIKENIFQ